jgi:hypothetical protein
MSATDPTIAVLDVRARKDSIARLAVGYRIGQQLKQESLVQLTNPIGQHLAFYVHDDEKKRFIDEMRKLLAAWEAQP